MPRYVRTLLILIALLTLAPALVNLAADPLFRFRAPTTAEQRQLYFQDSRLQLPGLARHSGASDMLIGSSIAGAFAPAVAAGLSQQPPLLLPLQGATGRELSMLAGIALSDSRRKRVIWLLDWFAYATKPQALREEQGPFPHYLFGGTLGDDLQYLFNGQTLSRSLALYLPAWRSAFFADALSSREALFASWEKPGLGREGLDKMSQDPKQLTENNAVLSNRMVPGRANLEANLAENLVPHVLAHQGIVFYFVFPPRSLHYYRFYAANFPEYFELMQAFRTSVSARLGGLANVRLVDFEGRPGFSDAFDSFGDFIHFQPQLASTILSRLDDPDYRYQPSNSLTEAWRKPADQINRHP